MFRLVALTERSFVKLFRPKGPIRACARGEHAGFGGTGGVRG